jgi:hypothetical protein
MRARACAFRSYDRADALQLSEFAGNQLLRVKKARRDRQAVRATPELGDEESGRWDSNPRRPAWEA